MSRNTPGNIYRQLDLTRRRNGRVNANPDHVVFREVRPLALNNHVIKSRQKKNDKACMNEMMSLMDCLAKFNQDKTMCSKEVER